MKFSKLYRIYLNFKTNSLVTLTGGDFNYLIKVLRLKKNDFFRVFNELQGEYLAQIKKIDRHFLEADLKERLRSCEIRKPYSLTLALSIIKNNKMHDAISFATALDIDNIIPVIAERSGQNKINYEKLTLIIKESTEQSERLKPPNLLTAVKSLEFSKNNNDLLIYADENEKHNTLNQLDKNKLLNSNIILFIGPEGGYTDKELEFLYNLPNSYSISLGKNVLRTEVAVCAALAQIQLMLGNANNS